MGLTWDGGRGAVQRTRRGPDPGPGTGKGAGHIPNAWQSLPHDLAPDLPIASGYDVIKRIELPKYLLKCHDRAIMAAIPD